VSWRSWLGFPEKRSITSLPWHEQLAFNQMPPVGSGTVSQSTALSLGSVYAANRLLAQSISTLPLKTYRRSADGRVPMQNLPQLFDQLVTDGQLVPWLHRCVVSLGLRGNAYGWVISRDGFGFPTAIEWLDPSIVSTDDRPGRNGWLVNGREVAREDVVHIPLFALPGQRVGLSPIGAFARTLGVALQAQTYASEWFAAGGFPPGTFRNTQKTVTQDEAEAIKARVTAAIRSRSVLTYGADWEYSAISVPPEEAQFVETMKMTTNQIAAIYGIPPEMIGGESGSSMTYANVEQQQINFVMFTLRPWLVALESAFSALLPDKQYVKFNADALIRADLKTRWEVNKIRVDMGAASIDEIRLQEDQPPLPNGQGQGYGPASQPALSPPPAPAAPIRRVS
jgi:HK97 family phage portal protein